MAIETVQIVVGDAWTLLSAAAAGAVDARVIIGANVLFSFGASEPSGRDGSLLPRFSSASFADKVWARCPSGFATLSVLRTVDASNPALPALGALTFTGGEFQIGAAAGTEIGTFGGLAAGDVIDRIVPNDGRVVLNGDRTKLLVGMTASDARSFKLKVYTSNPKVPGYPKAFEITVTPIASGGGGATRRLMGQGRAFGDGLAGRKSDGTVNSFNTDEGYFTPVDIPNPAPIYAGFVIAAAGSVDVPNVVQYHTVLYPQGGGAPIDFAGGLFDVASGTVIAKPAPKAGVTIPAGFHRVRTFGKVPSGGFFYYTGRFRTNASTGHGVGEVGVDLADKAAGGTISSQPINLPMTFLGFEGDAPAGHRTIAVAGDSNSEGIGYGATPRGIGGGILAAHLEPRPVSYVQIGRSGAGPIAMRNGYAKIAAFLAAIGATDWWCHAGTNDYYGSNVNATSEKAVMKQLLDIVLAAAPGIKTWWATMPPIAAIAGSPTPATASNQSRLNSGTTGGYDTDDRRLVVNDWLRSGGLVGLTGYTEHALPVQRSDDPYKWTDDSSRDGLHYYNTGVATSGGGAVLAALAAANPLGLPAA